MQPDKQGIPNLASCIINRTNTIGGVFIMTETKTCTKCGKEKPRTTEYFTKHPGGRDGFNASCKECKKEYDKKHRELNDYKIEEYGKKYREKNKEKIKKYRKENKEKIVEQRRQWKKNNAEKIRIAKQKRNASKKMLEATLTTRQWNKIKNDFNSSCAYCGISEETHIKEHKERLHQDHFISLEMEGEYTHNNIIPACRKCNSSKHTRDFFEWYPSYEHYDKAREDVILEYLGYINKHKQQLALF